MSKLVALVVIATALGASSPALAHRLAGTGGRVKVTGWGRSTIDANLMEVRGKLRLGSIRPDTVVVQCRIRIRTTEGYHGYTRRRLRIPAGGAIAKRWKIFVMSEDDDAFAYRVAVPHCHQVGPAS